MMDRLEKMPNGKPGHSRDHNVDGVEVENASGSSSDGTDLKVFDTEAKRHMPVVDASLFPDGGIRAWSVVGGSFLLVFCTFGDSRRWHC